MSAYVHSIFLLYINHKYYQKLRKVVLVYSFSVKTLTGIEESESIELVNQVALTVNALGCYIQYNNDILGSLTTKPERKTQR